MKSYRSVARTVLRMASSTKAVQNVGLFLGARGRMPWSLQKRLAAPDSGTVEVGGVMLTFKAGLPRKFYWQSRGHTEDALARVMAEELRQADVFLDIGAHVGMYTMLAITLSKDAQIIAFEPVAESFAALQANVSPFGAGERVVLRKDAVSEAIGSATLWVPGDPLPVRAGLAAAQSPEGPGESRTVATCSIDSLELPEGRLFLKIDVEGAEPQVLTGGSATIAARRPHIVLECNPGGPAQALDAWCAINGYTIQRVSKEGLSLHTTFVEPHKEDDSNFLLRPISGWAPSSSS
jgi:FkbM family methyltransferase